MIKFFRKIRQKLLSENNFRKYLIYAIGEIILVVIGILIALQINNWNENKKTEAEEIKILSNLRADLENTLIEYKAAVEFNKLTIAEIGKLQDCQKNNLSYSEELDFSFGVFPHFYFSSAINSTYKSLQTIGIGIIQNDSLKNKIVNVYDVVLTGFVDYNNDENRLKSTIVDPFFSKHLRYLENSVYSAKPNNYIELINNKEFINILSLIKRQRTRGIEKYENNSLLIENLIDSINKELKIRN
ncbi:MAG: DUF6090 family protein [Bacteroidetes bacterium]|jgi:hypothetical protein|nr:DUF6090 family protein [Bacteroidota bacterium]